MKRILLFLATNLAILLVITAVLRIFNVQPYLTKHGLDYTSLLIFAAIVGFTGAFISLFISKWMAIRAFNIHLITQPSNEAETWLVSEVRQLAKKVNIGMPEVGIYQSPEPNAFATGWNKNNALVAVSTGLLANMNKEELEGVLGHEISHVANGDMVTLTLIQGVLNTFVVFFARVAAFFVSSFLRRGDGESQDGFIYYGVAIVFELLFGILASIIVMWFSRYREFRADSGSAKIVGKEKMIEALQRLKQISGVVPQDDRAPSFNSMKIFGHGSKLWALFSSHPPLEKRIQALENYKRT